MFIYSNGLNNRKDLDSSGTEFRKLSNTCFFEESTYWAFEIFGSYFYSKQSLVTREKSRNLKGFSTVVGCRSAAMISVLGGGGNTLGGRPSTGRIFENFEKLDNCKNALFWPIFPKILKALR